MSRTCECGEVRRPGYACCQGCYEAYVQSVVDTFPPLAEAQRDKIRVLFAPPLAGRVAEQVSKGGAR